MELEQYQTIMDKLEELHGDFREHKGRTEEQIISIKEDVKEAKLWENVKVIGVMPIMALLHHFFSGKGQ